MTGIWWQPSEGRHTQVTFKSHTSHLHVIHRWYLRLRWYLRWYLSHIQVIGKWYSNLQWFVLNDNLPAKHSNCSFRPHSRQSIWRYDSPKHNLLHYRPVVLSGCKGQAVRDVECYAWLGPAALMCWDPKWKPILRLLTQATRFCCRKCV